MASEDIEKSTAVTMTSSTTPTNTITRAPSYSSEKPSLNTKDAILPAEKTTAAAAAANSPLQRQISPRIQGGVSNDEPWAKVDISTEEDGNGGVEEQAVDDASMPPDGGYGWVCVGCVFMVNACTWGLNSAYGVYLAYYLSHHLHANSTPYHYAFIGGLSVAVSMTMGPLVAFLFRRGLTTQHIMFLGVITQVGGLIAASFLTHSLVGLFFTQGVLFGISLGLLFTSSIGTISQWFNLKRSVANGISAAGSGVGGIAFSIGIARAIEDVGLDWSFRITALVVGVINALATLLIRDRNKQIRPTQNGFDITLFRRNPAFIYVLLWGFFSLLGYVVILFSLADYGRTVVSLTPTQSSVIAAMLSLGMTFGRPLVGWVSDTHGRINISWLMTALSGLTVFSLWLPSYKGGYALCIVFAIINGAVCGTFWTTISPVTTEIVGLKELPSALSIVWLSTVLPTTFSEAIALAMRKDEGGKARGLGVYIYPQIFSGIMYLVAAVMIWIVRVKLVGNVIRKERETRGVLPAGGREGETEGEGGGEGVINRWRRGGKWWRWVKV